MSYIFKKLQIKHFAKQLNKQADFVLFYTKTAGTTLGLFRPTKKVCIGYITFALLPRPH